jgi:hypothetical protein
MRYAESKDAVSSGLISKDEKVEGKFTLETNILLFHYSRCHEW